PVTDYTIHALGPEQRAAYLANFRQTQPAYVQTARRSDLPYEEWLQKTTWGFYEELCLNYEVLGETYHTLLWRRNSEPWKFPAAFDHALVPAPGGPIELPVDPELPRGTIAVVRVKYQVSNPWRCLPVLGLLPRYLLVPFHACGSLPISLPPY